MKSALYKHCTRSLFGLKSRLNTLNKKLFSQDVKLSSTSEHEEKPSIDKAIKIKEETIEGPVIKIVEDETFGRLKEQKELTKLLEDLEQEKILHPLLFQLKTFKKSIEPDKKRSKLQHIIHLIVHSFQGAMIGYYDMVFFSHGVYFKLSKDDFPVNLTFELIKLRPEILKFLPYLFFILVPFAELALPFYLALFPNATPHYFYSKESMLTEKEERILKSRRALSVLTKRIEDSLGGIYKELKSLSIKISRNPDNVEYKKALFMKDQEFFQSIDHLWEIDFKKRFSFENLTTEEKYCLMDFLYMKYFNGLVTVNTVLQVPYQLNNLISQDKVSTSTFPKFDVENRALVKMRDLLLKNQLKSHLKSIKKEDELLKNCHAAELESFTDDTLEFLLFKRGVYLEKREAKISYLRDFWLSSIKTADLMMNIWVNIFRANYYHNLVYKLN